MFGYRCSSLGLCLVCALTVFLCLPGCRKKGSADEGVISDKAAGTGTKRSQYTNDIDRLGQLTDRINKACRGNYVVVLGAGDITANGGLVSVDYALFDKLSDDGAAVMIAEVVTSRSKLFSQTQAQANIGRVVLQVDEAVGRYIARAGFNPGGFAEWLKAKRLSAAGLQQNNDVLEKLRIAAFMRGYSSDRYSKGK